MIVGISRSLFSRALLILVQQSIAAPKKGEVKYPSINSRQVSSVRKTSLRVQEFLVRVLVSPCRPLFPSLCSYGNTPMKLSINCCTNVEEKNLKIDVVSVLETTCYWSYINEKFIFSLLEEDLGFSLRDMQNLLTLRDWDWHHHAVLPKFKEKVHEIKDILALSLARLCTKVKKASK